MAYKNSTLEKILKDFQTQALLMTEPLQKFAEQSLKELGFEKVDDPAEEVSKEKPEGSEGIKVVSMYNNTRGTGRRIIPFYELAATGLVQPLTEWMNSHTHNNKEFIATIKVAIQEGWLQTPPNKDKISFGTIKQQFPNIGMNEPSYYAYFRHDHPTVVRDYELMTVRKSAAQYNLIEKKINIKHSK